MNMVYTHNYGITLKTKGKIRTKASFCDISPSLVMLRQKSLLDHIEINSASQSKI